MKTQIRSITYFKVFFPIPPPYRSMNYKFWILQRKEDGVDRKMRRYQAPSHMINSSYLKPIWRLKVLLSILKMVSYGGKISWLIKTLFLGIFTVPESGTYRVSFNMISNHVHDHYLYVYHNDKKIPEVEYHGYVSEGWSYSNGGRLFYMELSQGDTLYLSITGDANSVRFWRILACFEYTSV